MVLRSPTGLPPSPLRTPLSAAAFACHFPEAVASGGSLALVVLRTDASERARERMEQELRAIEAFAYELHPGAYALLMPGASAAQALQEALVLRTRMRGALLRPGTLVDAGVAALEPGMSAQELFAVAAAAVADASITGCGAVVGRAPAPA